MPNRKIIIGPPGTGKTTKLLNIVEEAILNGVATDKIALLTFTKKASEEAITRAAAKFKLSRKKFPFFKTIHSFSFNQLGLTKDRVFSPDNDCYKDFAKAMNLTLTFGKNVNIDTDFWIASTEDDKLMMCNDMSRVRQISLKEQWSAYRAHLNWFALERVARGVKAYKKAKGLLDFTDMLERCTDESVPLPKLDLLVIDEAQDLSRVQWLLIERLIKNSKDVYIAGDDDQAIFNWSGADAQYFIDMKGEVILLDQSYRVPKKVQEVANRFINNVKHRRPKLWKPTENDGAIIRYTDFEHIDFSKGDWLVLARNAYFLYKVAKHLKQEGLFYGFRGGSSLDAHLYNNAKAWEELRKGNSIPIEIAKKLVKLIKNGEKINFNKELEIIDAYTFKSINQLKETFEKPWYEAFEKVPDYHIEYIRAMLRRGEPLQDKSKKPRLLLSTIHGAKGGEAANVALLTDVSSAVYENLKLNPDDELRTIYTGITRTADLLHVVEPETDFYFEVF